MAKIILFDQFTRHIYREEKQQIKKYDICALKLVLESSILETIEDFDSETRCFILMPLRHTFEEKYLKLCLEYVCKWRLEDSHPIYRRFYQATIKAISSIYSSKDLLFVESKVDYSQILDSNSIQDFNHLEPINNSNKLLNTFITNTKPLVKKHNNLIISVSGGVDSMVCLYLAKYGFPDANIKAISINYANRQEQTI